MATITLTTGVGIQQWTPPSDCVVIDTLEIWGPGGSGGKRAGRATGGGSGAFNSITGPINVAALLVSGTVPYLIGQGGAAQSTASTNGNPGSAKTWFSAIGTYAADIGLGGVQAANGTVAGGAGGLVANCVPTGGAKAGGNGGTCSSATGASGGGASGSSAGVGVSAAAVSTGIAGAGATAPAGGGAGGAASITAVNATSGTAAGGGGGGLNNASNASGAGANGKIVITYTPALLASITGVSSFAVQNTKRASTGTYIDAAGAMQLASVDVPRIDHSAVSPFAPTGLLFEAAATNFIANSTTLSSVSQGNGTAPTSTDVALYSGANVWKHTILVNTPSDGNAGYMMATNLANGVTYTASAWVWIPAAFSAVSAWLTYEGSSFTTTVTIIDLSLRDQWQRVSVTATATNNVDSYIVLRLNVSAQPQFIYSTCWQHEVGSAPTSFIPTSAGAVTRSADYGTIDSTADANPSLTGLQSTTAITAPTETADVQLSLSGQQSTADTTAPTAAIDVSTSLSGLQSTADFTAPSETIDVASSLTGIQSTGDFTAPTETADVALSLTGIESTGDFTAPTETADVALSLVGIQSTGDFTAPTETADAALSLTGIESTADFTAPTEVADVSIALTTGAQATGDVGSPTASAGAEVPLTGIQSLVDLGDVIATVESSVDATTTPAIVTVTTTLLAGTATGIRAGRGPSIDLPGYSVAKPAKTSISAQARGQTVACTVTLLAGRASSASLFAGKARGSAFARARPVTIKTALTAGSATGEQNWSDDELLILAMAA